MAFSRASITLWRISYSHDAGKCRQTQLLGYSYPMLTDRYVQILDLLASITGEKPSPSPTPLTRPIAALPKRKAEDELGPAGLKLPRTAPTPERLSRPNGSLSQASTRPADKPFGGSGDKQPPKPRPALDRRTLNEKASAVGAKTSNTGAAAKPLPSRPLANRPSPTDSGPPKKRSYAEIMARAKANSEHRESLGKIQHKTVERGMTMKERKEMKTEDAKKARVAARRLAAGGAAARPGPPGRPVADVVKAPRPRSVPASATISSKKPAPAEEKKIKKAALATTGYTGTARPRSGASTTARAATARTNSETQSRDRSRYGGPLSTSRRRYEEEEMDDFIVDDEEEEEQGYGHGRQYRYDSYDDESDMEAGMSDIEDEEQQASRYAVREDMEQEALEKRLKKEKEERKRKFLESSKPRGGGR